MRGAYLIVQTAIVYACRYQYDDVMLVDSERGFWNW